MGSGVYFLARCVILRIRIGEWILKFRVRPEVLKFDKENFLSRVELLF